MYPYASSLLKVIGVFTAKVECSDTSLACIAEFSVTEKDGRTLLGKQTSVKLGILGVGPEPGIVQATGDCDIKARYPHLFSGKVGLLKDFELDLHIDPSVKPVAQPLRRIPFGLREKVDKKLDELIQADIIEKVPPEPTK